MSLPDTGDADAHAQAQLDSLAAIAARVAGYDPNDLPLQRAAEVMERLVSPVTETEMIPLDEALGRVLAQDLLSPSTRPAPAWCWTSSPIP